MHWQSRPRHSTPGSHAGPSPHLHSLPGAQLSAPIARVHAGPEPQAQRPSAPHESAVPSQPTQALPLIPHDATLGLMHVPPLQQPAHESQPDIGAASVTVTCDSALFFTVTRARPSATTAPEERPSTKISTVSLSSESSSSTRTDEVLGSGSPAASGRSVGASTSAVSWLTLYRS